MCFILFHVQTILVPDIFNDFRAEPLGVARLYGHPALVFPAAQIDATRLDHWRPVEDSGKNGGFYGLNATIPKHIVYTIV